MVHHPELIAGDGRPCTEMMRAHPGRVVTKVGAEGVYSALLTREQMGVGRKDALGPHLRDDEGVYSALLTREQMGVALKVEDGNSLASALAIAAVLGELGLRPQPESLTKKAITNSRGETVGLMRVNGGLLH